MADRKDQPFDPVNRPKYYNSHPSGREAVDVTEHMTAMLGSAVKYLWRRDLKDTTLQNLEKALWCLRRELEYSSPETGTHARFVDALRDVVHNDTTILGHVAIELLAVAPDLPLWSVSSEYLDALRRTIILVEKEIARVKGET